jgi:beta-glucosidase
MGKGGDDRMTVAGLELSVVRRLGALTRRERVRLVTGAGFWCTAAAPELGLRSMVLSDGPVGVRGQRWDEHGSAVLPSPTAWAASWDEVLVERLGGLLAAEARRKGVDVVLGPTVNLHRSPLAGRHFECLSEDPLLSGRIGVAYVRGLQVHGVGACAKHYVANDSESSRFTVDVRVDERTLRELYLAPFESLVVDGGVWMVMAAYNGVNGTTMTGNLLLTDPLVAQWGFDGVVVSDWYAARSTVASALAGLGLVMPGPAGPWGEALVDAVGEGSVPADAVADKAARMLRLAGRVGALADEPVGAAEGWSGDRATQLLRGAAAEAMVLLRNAGAVLPLDCGSLGRVAVLGPNAAEPTVQGGGSAELTADHVITPLQGIRAALGNEVVVEHVTGAYNRPGLSPIRAECVTCPACGRPGLAVRYLDPAGRQLRAEHRMSGRLVWFGEEILHGARVEASARFRAPVAGRWRFGFAGTGTFTFTVDARTVIEETVCPNNPSFAASYLDPPQRWVTRDLAVGDEVDLVLRHQLVPDLDFARVVLGVAAPRRSDDEELQLAVAAARRADAAIVVIGTTEQMETEGRDRTSLALPGGQDDLVRAVAAVNSRTVVVVNAGAPVAMPWRDDVAAILLTWFPGQEFGTALADVLIGAVEPGGRLPTTWTARDDIPVPVTRPVDGRLHYREGLHVGYRTPGISPAFPFGFGLGYTTWSYESIEAPAKLRAGADLGVSVRIRNTGGRRGKEVVQAYLSRPDSTVARPMCWLAGFAVARADPGEEVEVLIPVAARALQHWSTEAHAWETEPGDYRLTVGPSVADRPIAQVITVMG